MSAAKRWADAYERAWRARDGEAAAALYAEDCVFRSHPFRELEDARTYMRRVVPEAEAPEVWFGEPVEDEGVAAVEYWPCSSSPMGPNRRLPGFTGCGSAPTVWSPRRATAGISSPDTAGLRRSGGADSVRARPASEHFPNHLRGQPCARRR